jgi:hypothetical protein
MEKQMELFEDGGLKDEGGMVDEESGNEVPVGGTRKGVRDDIPANISEGEFIFPEDVTRYIGLDKLMQLRQDAKMGLKRMEAMGQMGNSDEATMEDDLPFGMADLIIVGGMPEGEEELNMAEGGLTTTATGSTRTVAQPTVEEPTTPVTTQPTATRRLTPEPVATSSIPIDFKQLMGDAAIEYKEYRNAAGESVMIPFVGGVAQFPVPDGYTLYSGTDAVVNTNTTAGAIVRAANTATAEVRAASMGGDNDTPPPMPTAEAINWSGLSTKELIERSAELTGTGSTIAKGAMAFLGPFGAIGYAMMRHQEKKVAAEIATRLAKGGLTAAQRKSLTETQEKLAPAKVTTLFGKVIEFVGGALGLTGDDVEAAKKNTAKIETSLEEPVQDSALPADPTTQTTQVFDLGDVEGQYSTSPVGTPLPAPMRTQMDIIAKATEIASTLDFMQDEDAIMQQTVAPSGEDIVMQQPVVSREQLYASDANQQPVFDQPVTAEPSRADQILSAKQELIQDAFQTNVANIRDPRKQEEATGYNRQIDPNVFYNQDIDMGAAGYGPQPLQKQMTSAFDPSYGNYAVTPQQVAYSTSTSQSNEDKYDPRGILPTAEQLESEKFPVPPSPVTVERFPVPPSPITGTDLRPKEVKDAPILTVTQDQVDAQRAAQAGPEVPGGTLPISTPISTQTQQAFNTNLYTQPSNILPKVGVPTKVLDTKGLTPTRSQVQTSTTNDLGVPTKMLDTKGLTPTPTQPVVDTAMDAREQYLGKPRQDSFKDAFNRNRLAGKETFTFRGKEYTTQTAEEAAPAGTNTLIQSAKNILTPFDNKEYVGGKLVTTKKTTPSSGRTTAEIQADINKETKNGKVWTSRANSLVKEREASKSKSSDKNIVTASSGKKVTVQTKPSSNKTEGAVSAGGQYAGDGFEWKKADNGNYLTRTYTGVNENATGSNDTSSASSSSDSKIVCTAMNTSYGFGSYRQAIWLSYSEKNLTKAHEVGYHTLFKPLVKLGYKKNNKIVRAILENIARNRTADLRAEMQGKKRNTLGRIYRAILEPTCYIVGKYKMFKDK